MKTFTQTSDKPYDRNFYRVGSVVVDNWDHAVQLWLVHRVPIEVLDPPKRSKSSGGGF